MDCPPTGSCMQAQVHRVVNDPLLQDGMQVRWDLNHIERHVAAAVDELKPALVCHRTSDTEDALQFLFLMEHIEHLFWH